jgi:hypothetical protein
LIVALQLLLENDTANASTARDQPFGRLLIGTVQTYVVGQLSRLGNARVEGLPRPVDAISSGILEDFPSATCQGYERRPRAADDVRHCSHQPEPTEVRKVLTLRCGTAILVSQIRGRNDSKYASRGQRSDLGSSKVVLVFTGPDAFTSGSTRQLDIARKTVAVIAS